ncbi:hypothetical protein [Pararhodobacter zhoushanensis]|uniref:hypothetical protein n=1 Tax=Pararhodobacter zhoushanensis TaxID=2479545 RepID=UPI000F8DE7A0|nr:hypothetical protein [Pararhodobacter zhoushanensis]
MAQLLLTAVDLPTDAANRYLHAFSARQHQRISIARVLASRHRVLICDVLSSELDLPVRAQILNLMKDQQARLGLTILFISQGLSVLREIPKISATVELFTCPAALPTGSATLARFLPGLRPDRISLWLPHPGLDETVDHLPLQRDIDRQHR